MNTLIVDLGGRQLRYAAGDFPLSVGGPRPHVPLFGNDSSEPSAHLGRDHGEIFIQPSGRVGDAATIACNGVPLIASRWLEDGDLLTAGNTKIRCVKAAGDCRLVVEELSAIPRSPEAPSEFTQRPFASEAAPIEPLPFSPRWRDPAPRPGLRLSPRLFAVAALFVALAACSWYVLTAHAVVVRTDPPADRLSLAGGATPGFGGRYLLRPGSYRLRAERSGYLPIDTVVEVGRGRPADLRFRFEPLGGTISVASRPVSGASVTVDGEPVGTTPIDALEVSAGEHTLEVRAPLHLDYSTAIRVEPGDPPASIVADLVPNWAPVSVASAPTGADIRVDRSLVGTTPTTLRLEAGLRNIEVLRAGYKPARRSLQIVAGEAVDLGVFALVPEDGRLVVSSQPDGASVMVGSQFRGTTPLELTVPPGTPLEVRVSLADHATFSTTATVASGERADIRAVLERLTGEVVITSEPPGAEILIDGAPRGRTGQTVELEARPYQIEVLLDGYVPFRTVVTPEPGLAQAVRAALKPVGVAGLPQTTSSPQGAELVLINPGRLTMGAPRREPGRRANEVLREVEITKAFYLAVREVSNREFREFKSGHLSGGYGGHNLEIDHHPVVNVSWEDAARYCNWLSEKAGLPPVYVERGGSLVPRRPLPLGYRLPTEAEWAWAARYSDSASPSKYAWGDSLPLPPGAGNYGDASAEGALRASLPGYQDGFPATAPVGSFTANGLGLHNLGGNVAEWVQDFYTFTPTAPGVIEQDPTGPPSGTQHVIRGGSWMDTTVTELRLTYRDSGDQPRPDLGFRIARSAE